MFAADGQSKQLEQAEQPSASMPQHIPNAAAAGLLEPDGHALHSGHGDLLDYLDHVDLRLGSEPESLPTETGPHHCNRLCLHDLSKHSFGS